MPIQSYILPALTVISFLVYILAGYRAWLPKAGTTEWIKRTAFPEKFNTENISNISKSSVVAAAAVTVGCFGLGWMPGFIAGGFSLENAGIAACVAVSVGCVCLVGKLVFGKTSSGVLAALLAAAGALISEAVSESIVQAAGAAIVSLYILSVCMMAKHPLNAIWSGILLGIMVLVSPGYVVFLLLGLFIAIFSTVTGRDGRYKWMFPVFSIAVPTAIFIAGSFIINGELSFNISLGYSGGYSLVYFCCALVAAWIAAAHIFLENSFSGVFIAVGALVTYMCAFLGESSIYTFMGLAMSFYGDIIFKRGARRHKAAYIVFITLMCVGFLVAYAALVLRGEYPELARRISEFQMI